MQYMICRIRRYGRYDRFNCLMSYFVGSMYATFDLSHS